MNRSTVSEERIASALRQAEGGTPASDVGRQLGIGEATLYLWKTKFAHLGVRELRRLRQVEDENRLLKQLVADLTLDKHMLTEALRNKPEADTAAGAGRVVRRDRRRDGLDDADLGFRYERHVRMAPDAEEIELHALPL